MLDKAGKTEVEISTAPFDIGAVAPGNITEVELWAIDPRRHGDDDGKDGKGRFHKEFDHLREGGYVHWFFPAPALADHAFLAPVNTLVQVTGTVKELNGELGAHAECVLLVDGVQADTIGAPIWVDASGTTTCAFTTEFKSAGPHTLTVRAQNLKPDDKDD